MARVELLDSGRAPLLARPFYEGGDPGVIVAALAQVPELLDVAMPFIGMVLGPSSVPARTKEIVILRVSMLLGCEFCIGAHTLVALDTGLTDEEVRALRGELASDAVFTLPAERALVEWVDATAGQAGAVASNLTATLQAHVEDHELVELTVLVGTTILLNRLCTVLELPTAQSTRDRLVAEGFS